MRYCLKFFLAIAALSMFTGCSKEDEFEFDVPYAVYKITGRVVDGEGEPVEGIRVTMSGDYAPLVKNERNICTTDDEGKFSVEIIAVPAGYIFTLSLSDPVGVYEQIGEYTVSFENPSYSNGTDVFFKGTDSKYIGDIKMAPIKAEEQEQEEK